MCQILGVPLPNANLSKQEGLVASTSSSVVWKLV